MDFRYEASGRNYVISGRENLEKLFALGISTLHSKKHARFAAMMSSYKQYHYKPFTFRKMVLDITSSPHTTREIAAFVGRGESRVVQTLTRLRRTGRVQMFKVRSSYYWTKSDPHTVIISAEKFRILSVLTQPRRQSEIARLVGRTDKTVCKRLQEMTRIGLVEKVNSNWRRKEGFRRVIAK